MRLAGFNEGARLLAATGLTLAQVAKLVEKTPQGVGKWRRGECAPDPETRGILLEKLAIPCDAWERSAAADDGSEGEIPAGADDELEEAVPERVEGNSMSSPNAGRAAAVAHLQRVTRMRETAEKRRASAAEIARWLDLERRAIRDFAQINGELSSSDEARILTSAKWQAIRSAIERALRPYPEAMQALAEELARFSPKVTENA